MLKNKIKIWSEFNRNVITLFMGTTLAQAIPIVFAPLLTRIYEPEQYGLFSLFFGITNICGIVATGRYEMAIILPKEEAEVDHLQRLCYFIAVSLSVVLLLCVFVIGDQIVALLDAPAIAPWLFLIPAQVALMGILQTVSARLNRERKFRKMSLVKITQNASNMLFALALGVFRLFGNGLIIGHVAGFITAVVVFVGRIGLPTSYSIHELKNVARRYHRFILFNAPTALLNTVASTLPLFFLSRIASKNEVGFYGLVERVINAPIALVAYAVSQVLLEDVATRYKEGRPIRPVLFKVLRNLFLIGIVPFSILFFFAEDLFLFVFGREWAVAGRYASILSVAFFFRFMVSPLSVVFVSLNRLGRLTIWQTLYFSTTMAVVLFSYSRRDVEQFLTLVAINDVVMYSLYIYLIQSIAKK